MKLQKEIKFDGEHAIGLDINHERMIATHFVRTAQGLILDQLVIEEIAPDSSDRLVSQQIRNLWKRHRFSTHTVCTSLHGQSKIVRYFSYNNLTPEELPHVLSLEAEETLQMSPDQVVAEWVLNSEMSKRQTAGKEISGVLIAAPRSQVQQQISLLREGGVYPVNMEVSYSALVNFYQFMTPKADWPATCLISLSERTADIVMLADGKIYPRTLFSVKDGWAGNLGYLLENVKDALLYYHLKIGQEPIQKILLAGQMPNMPTLGDRLAESTSLSVSVMDYLSDPRLAPIIQKEFSGISSKVNLAIGLGLGLRMPKNG